MSDDKEEIVDEIVDDENVILDNEEESYLKNAISGIKASEITEDDKEKYTVEVPKKKKGKPKKDIPTPDELENMSDEEVESNAETIDGVRELYLEFNTFLEDKAKIKEDIGIKTTFSTGIDLLDAVMGGGFAIGTLGSVVGSPGSGKSMLAIQSLGSAQQIFKGDVLCLYLDSEEATTTVRMANLGVKFPKIKPYNDITVEKVFVILENLCAYKEMKGIVDQPSIIIWDSVANTLTTREREVEDINSAIGYKGRMLSILIPKYISKMSKYNVSMIAINQLRDSIQIGPTPVAKDLNFMRQGKTIPGGNAFKFNAFHLLDMRAKSALDPAKYGFDGIMCEVKCIKNKLFPPNIKIDIVGDFVRGFSNFWTNYTFLVDNKRLTPGSWNWLNSMPNKKFRTKDAKNMYDTDQEFKQAFDESVKECIDTELVKKYNPII